MSLAVAALFAQGLLCENAVCLKAVLCMDAGPPRDQLRGIDLDCNEIPQKSMYKA